MERGRAGRATHATGMNDASSRSHELLSFRVASPADPPGTFRRLNLVDLAGSERVGRSKVEGQQLAEAQSINKSLSALGDVVAALQAGSPHVPYRNSKLTAVLQDSLCGNSKVLLVCNVAPEAAEIGETLSSLGFAQRAAQVRRATVRELSHGHDHCAAMSTRPAARVMRFGTLTVLTCLSELLQHFVLTLIRGHRWRWASHRRARRRQPGQGSVGTPPLRLSSGRIAPAPGRKRAAAVGKENGVQPA